MVRLRIAIAAAWLVTIPAWLLGPGAAVAAGHIVVISGNLDPATLTIAPGDQVTWRNDDTARHRVRTTSGPGEFDSGDLDPGESYTVTLTATGTYAYRDERNKDAAAYWGSIVVSAAPVTPAPGATSGQPPTPPPSGATVHMAGRTFTPSTITIGVGGTVTWLNDDDRQHTASATGGSFDSGVLNAGASYSRSFPSAGTFPFLCQIHPDMTGTILVSPAPGATAPPPAATPAPTAPAGGGGTGLTGDVTIVDFAFRPGDLTVDAGSRVTIVNAGVAIHTVTATDGSFDSGLIGPGASYSRTFATPGTFPFLCTVHPAMAGTIRVRGPGGATPPPAVTAPPATAPPSGARIVDFAFEPETVRVPLGTTVAWVNSGVAPHSVTSVAGTFDSGILGPGASYSRRFDSVGTFPYLCVVHPAMTGTVIVEGAVTGPASGEPPGSNAPAVGAGTGTDGITPGAVAGGGVGGIPGVEEGPVSTVQGIDPAMLLLASMTLGLVLAALGGWLFVLGEVPGMRRPSP